MSIELTGSGLVVGEGVGVGVLVLMIGEGVAKTVVGVGICSLLQVTIRKDKTITTAEGLGTLMAFIVL